LGFPQEKKTPAKNGQENPGTNIHFSADAMIYDFTPMFKNKILQLPSLCKRQFLLHLDVPAN